MAQIIEYINFVVYFNNPEDYAYATGLTGGPTAQLTPKEVADAFGFVDGVNFNTGGPLNPDKGMYGIPPYGIPTVAPGVEVLFPLASGVFVMWDEDDFLVPGQAGSPASIFPAGPDMLLKWSATFVLQNANVDTGDPDVAPVPKRRFVCGFELENSSLGGVSGDYNMSRAASRTLEGIGFPVRSNLNQNISISTSLYVTPENARKSWERFYMRVLTIGNEEATVWSCYSSPQPLNGASITVNDAGDGTCLFTVYNRDVGTLISVGTFILSTGINFHKFDILINFGSGGITTGRLRVYVDGQLAVDATLPAGDGIGTNGTHAGSSIGINDVAATNGWEYDLDDWHDAEIPNIAGVESLTSIDWLVGTHAQLQKVDTVSPGTWVGPEQAVNQMLISGRVAATSQLTSSTSGDTIEGVTDADDAVDSIYSGLGTYICTAALRAVSFALRASTLANAQLGYKLAGGSAVLSNVSINTSGSYDNVFYPGTGVDILPATIVPASAVFVHPADSVQIILRALGLEVQYVGIWGTGDGINLPDIYYQHNAAYPTIAQAFLGPVAGPTLFAVEGGTYVGNDDVNTITIPLPVHFLYIRPVGTAEPGCFRFGGGISSHAGFSAPIRSDMNVRVDFDPITQTTTFTVTGTSIQNNSNGVTYQYIAVCDPGYRFCISGAYIHVATETAAINPLLLSDSGYTPSGGFLVREIFTTDINSQVMFKGVGHTGTIGNNVSGAVLSNLGEFGDGTWISGTDAQESSQGQVNYCFFRPGDNCDNRMFYFTSYTGDGNNPRVITFSPSTGRYPLMVYVQPHDAPSVVRDPSDVGTSSRIFSSGTAIPANGISACGLDSITVGSQLNANGIIYDVFVILGSDSGMDNGTYFPGLCDTTPLVDDPPPVVIPDIDIITDGGLVLNGTTPITLLKDASGIYTLVKDLHHDELLNRLPEQDDVDVKIPDPTFKTGYVGG